MGADITKRIQADPRLRTFIRRAGLLLAGLVNEPDYDEFPTLDVVARTLGYNEGSGEMVSIWQAGGWMIAGDCPGEPGAEDIRAVGDQVWDIVKIQTQNQRWADELVGYLTQESEDEDPTELDDALQEASESAARVRQGRAILAGLKDYPDYVGFPRWTSWKTGWLTSETTRVTQG